MKTLIAIPSMDQVPVGFASSLATLNATGQCAISFLTGSLIYDSRNKLAMQAIKGGFDYVMWFDSDMVFESDVIEKMHKHMEDGKDIVTGLYFRRMPPYTPVLFKHLEIRENDKGAFWTGYEDYPKDRPFKVEGCGFGCVMVRTSVLKDTFEKQGDLFQPFVGFGEDLAFCHRARSLGYEIWCDPTIKCGHVGHAVITEAFYETVRGGKNE